MPRTAYENTANAESLHSVDIRVDCGVGGANSSCGDTIYPINYVRNARPLIAVTNGNKTEKKWLHICDSAQSPKRDAIAIFDIF